MNNIYEAKYSKVKKIVGNIPVGEVKMAKVPGEDEIKVILRHSKKAVTIQQMSMDAFYAEMEMGMPSEKVGWMKDAIAASESQAMMA